MRDLWAWPSMLKPALIENLRRLAAETLASRLARLAADAYVSPLEREAGDTARPWPSALGSGSVVQLLHRVREYGFPQSSIRAAVEERLASQKTTAEAAIRGEHQRRQRSTSDTKSNNSDSLSSAIGSSKREKATLSVNSVKMIAAKCP